MGGRLTGRPLLTQNNSIQMQTYIHASILVYQRSKTICALDLAASGGKTGWKDVGWVHVAQDSDQWALVNMLMNLGVP